MKKVKIMLLSFALLSVVGAALAFKAKFCWPTCYTQAFSDVANNRWTCTPPGGVTLLCQTTLKGFMNDPNGIQSLCTTDAYVDPFGMNPTCTWKDGNDVITTALCAVLTTSIVN